MPCLSYFFKLLGDYLNFEHVKHGFFGRDISLVSFRPVSHSSALWAKNCKDLSWNGLIPRFFEEEPRLTKNESFSSEKSVESNNDR